MSSREIRVVLTLGIPNFFERESFLFEGEDGNAPRHSTDLPDSGTSEMEPPKFSIEGDSYEIVRDCSSHFVAPNLRSSTK